MIISLLLAALATPPPTLAVDSLIVGQYASKNWTEFGFDVPTWTNVTFRQVLIGKMGKTVKISKCVKMEMTDTVHVQGPKGTYAGGVLWSGPAPKFPRPVKVSKTLNATERKALSDFLTPKEMGKTKFSIRKVVRGDFNNDGRPDSLIEAVSVAKDYSLVLIAQGGRRPTALWWKDKYEDGSLYTEEIAAVADFDGDGVMELVLSGHYIEGGSGTVWTFTKDNPIKLVSRES